MRLKQLGNPIMQEGLTDVAKLVGQSVAGLLSPAHRGQAEVSKIVIEAKRNFSRYMGRHSQNLETVTWNTLHRYLSMPSQLGLSVEEIKKIFNDQAMKTKIFQEIARRPSKQVGTNQISTDLMKKNWSKSSEIIGSPADKDSAVRAEIAITHIFRLGAIAWLERQESPSDMPVDNTEPTDRTAGENPTKVDTATLTKIKQELEKLKRSTP